jgi:hypothetical protein
LEVTFVPSATQRYCEQQKEEEMALVNLDAMIAREDFAREIKGAVSPRISGELKLSDLLPAAGIRRQLRKPEFQRETNHWTPAQVLKFLTSFLDGAVIPSIILWRSSNFVFVIDGAHRLSALCAWIQNDYGDGTRSKEFYSDNISIEQKRIAARTKKMIESGIGSYNDLDVLIGKVTSGTAGIRAGAMNTRPIVVQQVDGDASVAEDSFFAINTQGTTLDDTEQYLIRNRRKPVAIGARAIVRAGFGHSYWSAFSVNTQAEIIRHAQELNRILFQPEAASPIKTLDLPLGGSASSTEALAVLIDFLAVANSDGADDASADVFSEDSEGDKTIEALKRGLRIANRITGNSAQSLGLHPYVYFSNEKGKHSRFLFLGMCALVAMKLRNNDDGWFRKFTESREDVETFLLENKSIIGIVLQNLNKKSRIPKMKQMLDYLVQESRLGHKQIDAREVFRFIGLTGRLYDLTTTQKPVNFTDEVKSQIFLRDGIKQVLTCPICRGYLDVGKSVSYDHITPIREGGLGTAENGQMVHPYCNSGMKG